MIGVLEYWGDDSPISYHSRQVMLAIEPIPHYSSTPHDVGLFLHARSVSPGARQFTHDARLPTPGRRHSRPAGGVRALCCAGSCVNRF